MKFAIWLVGLCGIGAVVWYTFQGSAAVQPEGSVSPTNGNGSKSAPAVKVDIGDHLGANAKGIKVPPVVPRTKAGVDPVAIENCRITAIDKVDLASARDGILNYVGTNAKPGETIPADRVVRDRDGKVVEGLKKLKEDDTVVPGQLLAQLDDRVVRDEWLTKKHEIVVAMSEWETSKAAEKESKQRWETGVNLRGQIGKAMSLEEVNERKFAYEKYHNEVAKRKEEIELAKLKMNQAYTVMTQHELRSPIHGVIKAIYRNPGEGIKSSPSYEPVFHILNIGRLRAEGLVDEQYLPLLRKGMKVLLEPSQSQGPEQTFVGHLQEITGVAVTRDKKKPLIVSASLDGTVRVWERAMRHELRILRHPVGVRAVACTPADEGPNLCLTGAVDGSARLWDLDSASTEPVRELAASHRGPITCVAFSPDGSYCATGGDDRDICLWNTNTGELMYRITGHSGGVTCLQFTPSFQLVSAARDNTIRIWEGLGTKAYDPARVATITRRSGDVTTLGISPDGRSVLFDPWQSKSLRVLSLPEGLTEGVLQNTAGVYHFTTLALFSPDARWVLTAGSSDGRLQLWSSPLGSSRAYVQRQLVTIERSQPTCAAFAPNGSFMVVGSRDRHLHLWPMQYEGNIPQALPAVISNIEKSLESRQVRIWAEFDNPGALLPGGIVTMVRYPE